METLKTGSKKIYRTSWVTAKSQSLIAVILFFLSILLGLILRAYGWTDLAVNYKYIVHTHSHLALLGWLYLALTALILDCYSLERCQRIKYRKVFYFTLITIVGMMATFPWQGYAAGSILFSTLFLFASYSFAFFFFRSLKPGKDHRQSHLFFQVSLVYLVVSSVGPWALGAIMNTLGPASSWYRNAIYFYLHFQYNGWMTSVLIGIILYYFEGQGVALSRNSFRWTQIGIHGGTVLSFLLSVLWMNPGWAFHAFGGVGMILIFIGLVPIGSALLKMNTSGLIHQENRFFGRFISAILLVKICLQLMSALPWVVNLTIAHKDFVIAYLHWTFLGLLSPAILNALKGRRLIAYTTWQTGIYLTGFFLSEAFIIYRGICGSLGWELWNLFSECLWLASAMMGLAVALCIIHNLRLNLESKPKVH